MSSRRNKVVSQSTTSKAKSEKKRLLKKKFLKIPVWIGAGHWHAGGQFHCVHRKHLPAAQRRRNAGAEILRGRRPASIGIADRIHAYHHLCVCAHFVRYGIGAQSVQRSGPYHCVFAGGQSGGGHDVCALHVRGGAAQGQGAKTPVL